METLTFGLFVDFLGKALFLKFDWALGFRVWVFRV
jgi:hypothetical protein